LIGEQLRVTSYLVATQKLSFEIWSHLIVLLQAGTAVTG